MKPQELHLNEFEKEIMEQLADRPREAQIAILQNTAEAENDESIRRDIQALLVKLSARQCAAALSQTKLP